MINWIFLCAFRKAGRQILIIIHLVLILSYFKFYPKRKQKISGWNFLMEWILGRRCLNWQNFKSVKSSKRLRGGDFLKCYKVITPRSFLASTENSIKFWQDGLFYMRAFKFVLVHKNDNKLNNLFALFSVDKHKQWKISKRFYNRTTKIDSDNVELVTHNK